MHDTLPTPDPTRSPPWAPPTKLVVATGLFLVVAGLVAFLSASIGRVVIALLVAFVASYPIRLLERLGVQRSLAVILAYLAVIVVTALGLIFGIPALIASLAEIDWVAMWTASRDWLVDTLEGWRTFPLFGTVYDLSAVIDPILDFLAETEPGDNVVIDLERLLGWLSSGAGVVVNVIATAVASVMEFFIILVMAVFFSIFLPGYGRALPNLAPPAHRHDITRLLDRMWRVLDQYAGGMVKVGVFIGTVTWLALLILGIPGAFSLGVITGLLNVIPTLGPILSAVPGTFVALVQGSTRFDLPNIWVALIAIGIYTLVQQIETAATPRIMAGSVHVNPLVVFLSVIVGVQTVGILGALVAVPLILMAREVFRYVHAKLLDENPFPPKPTRVIRERF